MVFFDSRPGFPLCAGFAPDGAEELAIPGLGSRPLPQIVESECSVECAQVAEWLMAADCKSAAPCELRRFESSPVHQFSGR